MRMGFIGAGKVGFTLGKYFTEHGIDVSGYYSRSQASAKAACEFTHTECFTSPEELIASSDAIFLTVPDGMIEGVWQSIKDLSLTDKCICHCSGSMSSTVFSGIERVGAFGYSIHPLFAVSSKLESYKEISKAYFTIEGNDRYLDFWKELFTGLGNEVRTISSENKVLYHSAAVFASNLMIGLYEMSADLLVKCGFDHEGALKALAPLMAGNAASAAEKGPEAALTGPVERADITTVANHLEVLPEKQKEIYIRLSKELVKIAANKNPDRDYEKLKELLDSSEN